MAEAVDIGMPTDEPARAERTSAAGLRDRLSSLRSTIARPRWSADRVLAFIAALMIPAGVVSIALAWYGAAHTPFLFEQIPYLISGGLLGIGLLAAGAALYVGSWLIRMALDQRAHAQRLEESVARLREDLQGLAAATSVATPADPSRTQEIPAVRGALVATPTGTMYHLPDCSVVADRDDVREVGPRDREKLSPCKICAPA